MTAIAINIRTNDWDPEEDQDMEAKNLAALTAPPTDDDEEEEEPVEKVVEDGDKVVEPVVVVVEEEPEEELDELKALERLEKELKEDEIPIEETEEE